LYQAAVDFDPRHRKLAQRGYRSVACSEIIEFNCVTVSDEFMDIFHNDV